MNRLLALAAAASIAATASAQCFTAGAGTQVTAWTWTFTNDDGVSTNHEPLGFAFPVAGAAAGTFSHIRIGSNGWLMLTDGVAATGLPGNSNYGSAAALAGVAGDFPVVAPFWGDLFWTAAATNGVFVETNPGVSCKVTWLNVRDYNSAAAGAYSFSVELLVTGEVKLTYNTAVNNKTTQSFTNFVGVSARNGVAVPSASDFVPGPATSTGGMIFQSFALNTFDGQDRTMTFTPSGAGWVETITCSVLGASHTSYGSGCYNSSDSAYFAFATAALASPALSNTAITLTPAGGGYLMTSGGAFLPVGSVQATPTIVANGDDTEQFVPFTTGSFPGATGLAVCSNGFVSLATGNNTTWNVTAPLMLNDPQTSFRSAHDMNPTIAGSGQIKHEESPGLTMVTWDGVWDFGGTSAADANNVQIQLYPNGVVVIAWGTLSTLGASGIGYVVGYSPGGPSANLGSLSYPSSLPHVISSANLTSMALAASPAPVSTPSTGTLVTYTQSNIPEAAPTSGVYLGITILSVGQNLAGQDLTFLGMPGCSLHVSSLDLTLAFVGATNSLTTQFQIPAGAPYGFQLFAQSAALVQPNSLPNGQNAFGATLSNAVASFISFF
jgi:hypothetical protein